MIGFVGLATESAIRWLKGTLMSASSVSVSIIVKSGLTIRIGFRRGKGCRSIFASSGKVSLKNVIVENYFKKLI